MEAVLQDWNTAPVSPRLRAALMLAETMTRRPAELTIAFVASLRQAGLDTEAIEEAANVVFHFNLVNRLADAFEFELPNPEQRRRVAKLLQGAGKILGGKRESPSWTRSPDGQLRPVEVELGRNRLLEASGATDPTLRCVVEAYCAATKGGLRPTVDLPANLVSYVRKLASAAYKIVDEDVETLHAAGLDDPAVYELTFAGAFGTAVAPLERLFALLHGADEPAVPEHGPQPS